ncbi:hypothetical protein M422DRAFT_246497 [Sphaerobolus stellatus SS14]|nr:hypothetical protein M422DRAFT_246497 [Sphaerobolus stellatus SS14]
MSTESWRGLALSLTCLTPASSKFWFSFLTICALVIMMSTIGTSSSTATTTIRPRQQQFPPSQTIASSFAGQTGLGSAIGNYIWEYVDIFCEVLSRCDAGPVVAWGDLAMRYYGVPTAVQA